MARAQNPNIEVLEIAAIAEYHEMGKRLRDRGFEVDPSKDAPICRWIGHGILLDVMPMDESIPGFSKYWYASAVNTAKRFVLPNDMRILLINAAHFLATKLAAFDGRGEEDYVMSHDLEDVICVIDGRPGTEDEVRGSARDLRQ